MHYVVEFTDMASSSSPFLVLPSDQETPKHDLCRLYSLKQTQFYPMTSLNLPSTLPTFRCIGSSHGWLALLDESGNPFLIHLFSNTGISLPPKPTFFPFSTIHKLVLSSHPRSPHHAAVVIFGSVLNTKIAFCRPGDQEWTTLDCPAAAYYDVVCCDRTNTLFALGPGPLVESWDLTKSLPTKKTMIQDPCPRALEQKNPNDLYSSRWYLALSLGQVFLVVRYVGEFVRHDGEVVCEADTLTDNAAEPLVCPYKTVGFQVFKHDADGKEWIEVECLGDFAVFLGANQTVMVSTVEHPELRRNTVYFTDDWERMDEDDMYGGHDIGVFGLDDGSIEAILEFRQQKIEPPPFWVM